MIQIRIQFLDLDMSPITSEKVAVQKFECDLVCGLFCCDLDLDFGSGSIFKLECY